MTSSIIILNNSTNNYARSVTIFDCCQSLGSSVTCYKNKNKIYSYICVIPFDKIDDFFKKRKNLRDYVDIIDDVFNMHSFVLEFSDSIDQDIVKSYPFESHYYVEITVKRRASNKEIVAYHNALRYTWYLHYSNIATACVNLARLGILPDAMSILAIASSYQTEEGRALLPVVLSQVDSFIYFPNKENVLKELAREQNFNTAFMRTPIYYDPKIEIKGNFFSDSKPTMLSAKNLLGPLGSVDEIDEIPEVILNGIKKSLDDYMKLRTVYDMIVDFFAKNGRVGTDKIIITDQHVKKQEIEIKTVDPGGVMQKIKLNFIIN